MPAPAKPRKPLVSLWGTLLCLALAGLVATYFLFVQAPPPRTLVIATGYREGAYYKFAQRYAEELKREGLTLEVRETKGSVENLKLLQDPDSGVDVAIVQSGLAPAGAGDRLASLGSLYREPLWVFHRGDEALDQLGRLAGRRVAIGPPGSGTHAVAKELFAANGIVEDADKTTFLDLSGQAAADALRERKIDAACFVAAIDIGYVRDLLQAPGVRLLSFGQHEAYRRRYRFLSAVKIPAGLADLGKNLPAEDVWLVAPTATLVVRKDLHAALVPLLLTTAKKVHQQGDLLSDPGEFPSPSYTDIPLAEDAARFYESGPPVLQRLLPFWLAALADRLKVMLVPLVVLLMPLFRAAPPLIHWRTRRKIYRWYAGLRAIDQALAADLSTIELREHLARLRAIEAQVGQVEVPLSYMEEFYNLRLHLTMLHEKASQKLREAGG